MVPFGVRSVPRSSISRLGIPPCGLYSTSLIAAALSGLSRSSSPKKKSPPREAPSLPHPFAILNSVKRHSFSRPSPSSPAFSSRLRPPLDLLLSTQRLPRYQPCTPLWIEPQPSLRTKTIPVPKHAQTPPLPSCHPTCPEQRQSLPPRSAQSLCVDTRLHQISSQPTRAAHLGRVIAVVVVDAHTHPPHPPKTATPKLRLAPPAVSQTLGPSEPSLHSTILNSGPRLRHLRRLLLDLRRFPTVCDRSGLFFFSPPRGSSIVRRPPTPRLPRPTTARRRALDILSVAASPAPPIV